MADRHRVPRRAPSEQQLRDRANAMLGRRAIRRIGPRQYAIAGSGKDAHGQPNVWHVDLNRTPPYCDCPAFLNHPDSPQTCKHVRYFEQVERLLDQLGQAVPAA